MSDQMGTHFSDKWDIRTGSPRKLWRALHDFLEENGFAHEYQELVYSESHMEGTAIFSDQLIGYKDRRKQSSFWFLRVVVGIILCLTILLFPLGMSLIRNRTKTIRTSAWIAIEGEVYRTRGAEMRNTHASEVFDVVADARITLDILAGEPDEASSYEIARPIEDRGEIKAIRHEFEELEYSVNQLLPGQTLPTSTELREV